MISKNSYLVSSSTNGVDLNQFRDYRGQDLIFANKATFVFWTTESTTMVGKVEKQARPFSLNKSVSLTAFDILQTNSVNKLFKHWISCRIDVFGKRQVDLPCKPTTSDQNKTSYV